VDYYHNPDVRMLFSSVCDHRVCEPCIARLFQRGRAHPCPACGCSTRAEDFLEQPKETRKVASEAKVRRQVCDIFCKSEEDFPSLAEYNDFLEQRENIIYRLVNPSTPEEVQEAWRSIDQYREQNAEQILRAQNLQPRKKVQKILSIINEEGGFCAAVNSDWDERQAQTNLVHPFQDRYRDFLANAPGDAAHAQDDAPFAPQPLLGEHGPADKTRQMSGGGQCPDIPLKKARQFFFKELISTMGKGTNSKTYQM